MMSGLRKWTKDADEQALEEASEWKSVLERGGPVDQSAFGAWLTRNPRNVRAFMMMAPFDPLLTQFLRRQLQDLEAVELPIPPGQKSPRRWIPWVAVAASICLISAASWYWLTSDFAPENREYHTAIGEHRTFTLADGSIVHLNTQSRLESRFTRRARNLNLVAGEAYFIVAHDRWRPFRVHTDAATVQAIGTRFNVDTHGGRVVVSVLEGRVQLALPDASNHNELTRFAPLRAGESMEIRRKQQGADLRITTLTSEALEHRVAWISGLIMSDQESLANVVAEMNRYNRQQIVIADPAIEGVAIGGQFKATDPRTFVRGLQYSMNAEVEWPAPPNAATAPILLRGRPAASSSRAPTASGSRAISGASATSAPSATSRTPAASTPAGR